MNHRTQLQHNNLYRNRIAKPKHYTESQSSLRSCGRGAQVTNNHILPGILTFLATIQYFIQVPQTLNPTKRISRLKQETIQRTRQAVFSRFFELAPTAESFMKPPGFLSSIEETPERGPFLTLLLAHLKGTLLRGLRVSICVLQRSLRALCRAWRFEGWCLGLRIFGLRLRLHVPAVV